MSEVVSVARSLYGRALFALLLPFVFTFTLWQEGPPPLRDGILKAAGAVLLMTLGLATVYVIHGRI